MAEESEIETTEVKRKRRWLKRLGWFFAILLAPVLLVGIFLSTSIGKRYVADQIAEVAPASGLRFQVGRIEGDIYGEATLHDVVLSDPKGEFLIIPEVKLSWRPLAWLWSGIDIRELTARRGRLERWPELLPGDPDAPLLPDFDIRIDKLALEQFTIAPGVAGEAEQKANLTAKVDIRSGRAFVDANGAFGPEDTIKLLLDAEPDGDRFDLALDYSAAADGPIAALAGLDSAYDAVIEGEGTWSRWLGHALITRQNGDDPPTRFAGFTISNNAGTYGLLGQINPPIEPNTLLGRAAGDALSVALTGTLEESLFDGKVTLVTDSLDLRGDGAIDLAGNRFDGFDTRVRVRDPDVLGGGFRLNGALLTGSLDGPFRDLSIVHNLQVDEFVTGAVTLENLNQSGIARFDSAMLRIPLDASMARAITGNELIDSQLVEGRLNGVLTYGGARLDADNARLSFPGLSAELTLRGNTVQGVYGIAGPVTARSLELARIGKVSANAKLVAQFGNSIPWNIRANIAGRLSEVSNETVANVAGGDLAFEGALGMAANQPLVLRDVALTSDRLTAQFDSRIVGERTTVAGSGRHIDYGPFTIDAEIAGEGPRATLVLADPYPPAGLADVRLAIAPSDNGFAIDTQGQSTLGPFNGRLALRLPENAPARVEVERLRVFETNVTGNVILGETGLTGRFNLAGGGLGGAIGLLPAAGGAQSFDIDIAARQARFGGETPINIAEADISARGTFRDGDSRVLADLSGTGLEYGPLSIANFAAKAEVDSGVGNVTGSIAGRRSDRFALKFDGDIAPQRIAVLARGEYGGRRITMPRRAVFSTGDEGGWILAPTQIGYADGYAIVEGAFGGTETRLEAQLSRMPLRLADLAGAELGLGGRLSGILAWEQSGDGLPTANARIRIEEFSRSGLVLSSTPIDVLAVADLSQAGLRIGARFRDDGAQLGRLDARITGLSANNALGKAIMEGRLDASFAYDGDARSLWRLAAIETFDLTGPLKLSAKATGTASQPRITGSVASDDLRLQSAISGTDISDIEARGRFVGSRLELNRFAGNTRGGGTISGSGTVDLAEMSRVRGPQIDLRAAAQNARLLNANGLDATITGPLRIVSNGVGGTIAGRVKVDRASWVLGVAADDMPLPSISTEEINRPMGESSTSRVAGGSWRYLINASAPSRVAVDGLGLDSEWGIDLALRGTVNDPRLGGEARLVRGDYTFAGTRFDLTRGRIRFDESVPIDPRLDIEAETSANGTQVSVNITGNAQTPEVAFSSVPAMPEEEILAQLLFGGSVTSLSATDAVQLAAALAALRGGEGGIDPIGNLRRSIGLDQLRIVSADPALGRETGVALGKNVGRRVYVEIVTDGRGYSATSVEYRVTRWLALLGTVSTIGRDSVLAEISRDY